MLEESKEEGEPDKANRGTGRVVFAYNEYMTVSPGSLWMAEREKCLHSRKKRREVLCVKERKK